MKFDRWQQGASAIILGKRRDGSFAATVGGIVLSIPRQVGKTFLVGMIVVALCLLFPGLTVVWTAHRTRTATKTFHTLKAMTSRGKIAGHMLVPRTANGEQEIRFRNKSVIMFGAREQGFGRGFDEVDIAVFDEAQILTEKGVEDIVPATNQAKLEGGALLFFMGTPPRPGDPGEEFTNRRTAALKGASPDMVYIEFSADSDAGLDDPAQWAKANPSFPSRTPLSSIKRMRANLTDEDSFRREALGIWDEAQDSAVLSPLAWAKCEDATVDVRPLRPFFAIDVAPGHASGSIVAVAMDEARGVPVLELVDRRAGASWIPERVRELLTKYHGTLAMNSSGPVGSLIPELSSLDFVDVRGGDYGKACGLLVSSVNEGALRHHGEADFTSAIVGAKSRRVGDGFTWSRRDSSVDITPLVAATVGLWASASTQPKPSGGIW